tara:strand:- start:115 stop:339 length:225 start_codon:yes stop_codon:yes gene_type:complete
MVPPIKYKEDAASYDRATGKTTITHHYVKHLSKEEAFKMLNDHNVKPKVKQKIRNELVRRGIKIVYVPQTNEDV